MPELLDTLAYSLGDLAGSRPLVIHRAAVGDDDPIAQERAEALPDAHHIQTYRAYSRGEHLVCLTDEQREVLAGILHHRFADNVFDQVLKINADRLKVAGFRVDPPRGMTEAAGEEAAQAVRDFLDDFRVRAAFDREQNKINKATIRDGNHSAAVGWDERAGRNLLFQEPWWDGNTGAYVAYGEDGQPIYAVKEWLAPEPDAQFPGRSGIVARFLAFVDGIVGTSDRGAASRRVYRWRTVYHPDRIEKYRQEEGAAGGRWERAQRPGEPWPIPHLKRDGSPLGIPIVHFAVGGDDLYGQPVAPMSVVANQDFLNDTRYDLAACGRQEGFQRTLLAGFPTHMNRDGVPVPPEKLSEYDASELLPIPYATGPGMLYINSDPNAKAMVLQPGNPERLIAVYDKTLESISRQTQTPYYLLTVGANTSGAAILRAESPLAGKAQEQTESLGPAYATLMHRAVEMFNARNGAGVVLDEDALITPEWADTSKPDALADLEYQKAKVDLERARMVLEQEQKAVEEGRAILGASDDVARRLGGVLAGTAAAGGNTDA